MQYPLYFTHILMALHTEGTEFCIDVLTSLVFLLVHFKNYKIGFLNILEFYVRGYPYHFSEIVFFKILKLQFLVLIESCGENEY